VAIKVSVAKVTKPRRAPRKPVVRDEPKPSQGLTDKAIDLIKWVDTPFKMFGVVVLTILFGFGYFAWDSRQVILNAITSHDKLPQLKERDTMTPIAETMQRDLEATTVVVHKVNLVTNSRTTMFALSEKGVDRSLDGMVSSLFSSDATRNGSIIQMLAGEVSCDKLIVSGKTSDWESKQGSTFVCRGSIPPPVGEFAGYVSVTWKKEPQDLTAIKTRINLASTELAK
jgi:hypothetical protein